MNAKKIVLGILDTAVKVAFVVVVENGDFGIKSAGPIAGEMIKLIHSNFSHGR